MAGRINFYVKARSAIVIEIQVLAKNIKCMSKKFLLVAEKLFQKYEILFSATSIIK